MKKHISSTFLEVKIGKNSLTGCSITFGRESGQVVIGDDTFIGASSIICATSVTISSHVLMAWGITVVDHVSHSVHWDKRAGDAQKWREGIILGGFAGAAKKKIGML